MSEQKSQPSPPADTPKQKKPKKQAMSLSQALIGQEVILAEVVGGRGFILRLAEIGLSLGARFVIINKGQPGPFIINLKGARLVLGHGMIHRIFIYPA